MTNSTDFFSKTLKNSDAAVFQAISSEFNRQTTHIELIASENIVSQAVLEAQGSVLTNKYAEGYSGKRYYGGCQYVDTVETLAIERAKALFNCSFANVQPHSGAQANLSTFMAFLKPGNTFMGMSLNAGGHLTHGAPVTLSGKWFHAVAYDVNSDGLIDYDQVEMLAQQHKPKLIIAGGSAYPRTIDFARFRAIADQIGAYLMVDMAHYAGLIATDLYPSPFPHAHVVTSTTHKTLRGPRGGIILTCDADLAKKINAAVFPGTQGGPLMHVIAAKAVAFHEALQPSFKTYIKNVIQNTKVLAHTLKSNGFDIVSGDTDCHLALIDLRKKGITGVDAEKTLDRAGITCNKNGIPFDPQPPHTSSGLRIGAAAITTRGFTESDCIQVAHWMTEVIDTFVKTGGQNESTEKEISQKVKALCAKHPIYPQPNT